jgi:hypothetical protein
MLNTIVSKINLVSPAYQAAYLMATQQAALTGDDVYEFRTNTHTGFATGKAIDKVLRNQQLWGITTIQSLIKIV